MGNEGLVYYVIWLLYILLGSLTIMNMLVGVLVDVVSKYSESERNLLAEDILEHEIRLLDTDSSDSLDKDEFVSIINNPVMIQRLEELDVDVASVLELAEYVYLDVAE